MQFTLLLIQYYTLALIYNNIGHNIVLLAEENLSYSCNTMFNHFFIIKLLYIPDFIL